MGMSGILSYMIDSYAMANRYVEREKARIDDLDTEARIDDVACACILSLFVLLYEQISLVLIRARVAS